MQRSGTSDPTPRGSRALAGLRWLRARAAGRAAAFNPRFVRVEPEHQRTLDDLRARLERLESLVEGLQDAVHRESVRHDELIEELKKKTDPGEIARALSEDARRRGL